MKRIEYIDLAKGFCIILVVLVHIASFYTYELPGSNFFKAFRMPLYFFLSGCFFKAYQGFFDFTKRKINKLLIPFVFFYLITSIIVPYILYHLLHCKTVVLQPNEFLTAILNESFPNLPIWFLLCLFEESLIFYGLFMIAKRNLEYSNLIICIGSLLLGIIGLILGIYHINLPATIDSAFSALPFFAAGYMTLRKTNLLHPNKYDKYLPILIVGAFAFVYYFCAYHSFLQNKFTIKSAIAVYPCGLLGTYGVVMLAKVLKKLPLISYIGRYSIMVLVTHIEALNLYAAILKRLNIPTVPSVYLNLFLTLISYIIIIPIMKKYLPHVTAQKDVIKIA